MRHRTIVAGIALMALSGCGGISSSMTADHSVEIVQPTPMEVVEAPLEMRWTGDLPAGQSFGVFLDRAPIAPGRSLSDVFDDECDAAADCPDQDYLAARGIFVVNDNELAVPVLTPRGGVDGAPALEVHRATIVALDDTGTRRGEVAWTVEFRVDR